MSCGHNADVVSPADYADINSKLLYLEVSWGGLREGGGRQDSCTSCWQLFLPAICRCSRWCPVTAPLPMLTTPHQALCSPSARTRMLPVLQDAPFGFPVLMSQYTADQATGTQATEEQRAAVQAGGWVDGHVVLYGNTAFESRSNENITAQQEEVRREVGGGVELNGWFRCCGTGVGG